MQKLTEILEYVDSCVGGSQWFIFVLLGVGVFFTIYLKFPQIRFFKHAVHVLLGRYDKAGAHGDASHFQALVTALSGTVGTGNIAGVALAIHLGGPAAIFWMLVTAFLGMTTKMVEVTLSHKYREKDSRGFIAGGPMYYMKNGMKMKWLAVIFAVATIFSSFGTGNLPQVNSISNAMYASFGVAHWVTGAVLTVVLAFVIIGGVKRIVQVAARIVPTMVFVYIGGALCVLVYNYDQIWPSVVSIFTDVFTGTSAMGGFLGAGFIWAFNRGVNRGLFSNEAGQGSAPIAHAAARTSEPASEGMVAILEPFADTIVICSLTALVLLSSGAWKEKWSNTFQNADMCVLAGHYSDTIPSEREALSAHLLKKSELPLFSGVLSVEEGCIVDATTVLHARSVAEQINVTVHEKPYTGTLSVRDGKLYNEPKGLKIRGKSLLHSAPLSSMAFGCSFLGKWGEYIIPICLLLFAFSTSIAWSYYGDRAVTFLWGTDYVIWFRLVYIAGFFVASVSDTSIIWIISGITVACMTLPNLFGLMYMRKDVKSTIDQYWRKYKSGLL